MASTSSPRPQASYHVLRHFDYSKPLEQQLNDDFIQQSAEFDSYLSTNNLYSPFCYGPSAVLPLAEDSKLLQTSPHYHKKYKPARFSCWSRLKHFLVQPYRHQCDIYVPNTHLSTTYAFSTAHPLSDHSLLPKLPVCFYVHGGGFQRGGKNEMWRSAPVMSEYFATAGTSAQEEMIQQPKSSKKNKSEQQHLNQLGNQDESYGSNDSTLPHSNFQGHIDVTDHIVVTMNYSLSSSSLLGRIINILLLTVTFSIFALALGNAILGVTYAGLQSTHPDSTLATNPSYYFKWVNIWIVVGIFSTLFLIHSIFKLFLPHYQHPQHADDVLQCIRWCDANLTKIAPQADMSRSVIAGHSAGGSIVSFLMTARLTEIQTTLPNTRFKQVITISALYNYLTPSSQKLVNIGWWLLYTSGSIGYFPGYIKSCSSLFHLEELAKTSSSSSSSPPPTRSNPAHGPIHWLVINASDDLGLEHGGIEFFEALQRSFLPQASDTDDKEAQPTILTQFAPYPQLSTQLAPLDYSDNKQMHKLASINVNMNKDVHSIVETRQTFDNVHGTYFFAYAAIPFTTHASVVNRIYSRKSLVRRRIEEFISRSNQLHTHFDSNSLKS